MTLILHIPKDISAANEVGYLNVYFLVGDWRVHSLAHFCWHEDHIVKEPLRNRSCEISLLVRNIMKFASKKHDEFIRNIAASRHLNCHLICKLPFFMHNRPIKIFQQGI